MIDVVVNVADTDVEVAPVVVHVYGFFSFFLFENFPQIVFMAALRKRFPLTQYSRKLTDEFMTVIRLAI